MQESGKNNQQTVVSKEKKNRNWKNAAGLLVLGLLSGLGTIIMDRMVSADNSLENNIGLGIFALTTFFLLGEGYVEIVRVLRKKK